MRAGWLAAALLAAITVAVYRPVAGHGFLNWDDPDVVAANPRLHQPIADRVAWAFTTREMGHYQPLSWLALSAIAGTPPSPARVHAAAIALHAANAALLFAFLLAWLGRETGPARVSASLAAAALFALHPLRVEPVAWASALPYLLSYTLLLGATWAWTAWTRGGAGTRLGWSVALFALSQLTRVSAPLAPLVFLALAAADARAVRPLAGLWRGAVPFAVVALPLALLEGSARSVESLAEVGLAPRVLAAVTAPARYAWRTLVPSALTPLDVWTRVPSIDWGPVVVAVAASAAVVALTGQLWSRRTAAAVWGSYVLLLLPVAGLLPSGVQATADRYTYGPGMVLAGALAALLAAAPDGARRAALAAAGTALVLLVPATRAQADYWRDSASLWTRAVALDADNDVALYNLALAEAEGGRADAAIEHLQRLVALVPDHAPGRARLAALIADREEAAGDRAAAAGHFHAAIGAYDRTLDADPGRTRARTHRGMAHARLGRLDRAAADLEPAIVGALPETPVVSTLAFAWASTGRAGEALALLQRAHRERPGDADLAGNFAQLLLTADPPSLRDPAAALALAAPLNEQRGGRDPRVLALLADALAATGRTRDAVEALGVAIGIASDAGERALAAQLDARRRALLR